MSSQEHVLGLVDAGGEIRRPALVGMDFLHQRPVRTADFFRAGPRIKAQDLVRLLLGHRALARRVSAPRTKVSLSVFTPTGLPAVEIISERD